MLSFSKKIDSDSSNKNQSKDSDTSVGHAVSIQTYLI